MALWFWIAVILLALIAEACSTQLVSIWFVGGGLVAIAANALSAPFWLQGILAAAVTLILLLTARPMARRILHHKPIPTNADRVIGCSGVATQTIDNRMAQGRVQVLGNDWTARSADDRVIQAGARVRVERIEGVKLIVSVEEAS